MKNVVIVAPMEANGRYRGGIMTVANTLFDHRDQFAAQGIHLDKFNTYIRQRKAESIGRFDLSNLLNMADIFTGLLKATGASRHCDTLYYHSSIKLALLKDLLIIRGLRLMRRKQRIVLHIHFAEMEKILPHQKPLARWMLSMLKKHVDHLVFLSAKTRDEFVAAGVAPENTSVIYNFHDGMAGAQAVDSKIQAMRTKERLDLLFMGSIDQRKGILDLLEALETQPGPCVLHICGSCNDDSIKAAYEAKMKSLGHLAIEHGFVTGAEKEQLLAQADCMVLPSYGEGFPLVLIEAMARGCTCITTPVGAVPEFFQAPDNGYLFDAGNVAALTQCIGEVCHHRERTAEQMLRNHALSGQFTLDAFIRSICGVL